MPIPDKTVEFRACRLFVDVKSGKALKKQFVFDRSFTIGRDERSDLRLDDKIVSGYHARIIWEDGKWWLKDQESKNGTFIGPTKVAGRVELPLGEEVHFALDGPVLVFAVDQPRQAKKREERNLTRMFFDAVGDGGSKMGDRTRLFTQLWQESKARHKKRMVVSVSVLLTLLVGSLLLLAVSVARRNELEELAEQTFYTAKRTELALAEMRRIAQASGSPLSMVKMLKERQQDWDESNANYEALRQKLGVSIEDLPRDEWLIHKVARVFGECDVKLPRAFKETVKDHIARWRNRRDFKESILRTLKNGQAAHIAEAFMSKGLPPQLYYLGLQESLFDTAKVGPPTRSGYAKGMWQFIPKTGSAYGLQVGELAQYNVYDRHDERHNFEKSTEAATRYVRDLYDTLSQGSALLVMACYNWGEANVIEEVQKMRKSPETRNFWNLITHKSIPSETYNYVYSIVAAAVIGEDPRRFGLDFDNPLETAQKQITTRAAGQ